MRQIIIQENPLVKSISGSDFRFYPDIAADSEMSIYGGKVTKFKIPFRVKILSGGKIDLDFTLSEELAKEGVSLLGAYWDGVHVTAYVTCLNGFNVTVSSTMPILTGTLVQVVSYRQVSEQLLDGVVNLNESGSVVKVDDKPDIKTRKRKK